MDFFGYQQQARRYSVLLLVLFALAVVALVLAVNGVVAWGVLLLVGVFFGGMLGAATSGTLLWGKKGAANSDAQWKRIFGPQVWKRWVLAFIGAIILEYAAGIAGGCTSGLAISGGMLLAPAAFLFIMGMFASGIITALIIYRKRY